MNKYRNKKTVVDGIEFDSKAESNRYIELKLLEKAGQIKDLSLQPKFVLQPSFKKNGKTHRAIHYIADFIYIENGKNTPTGEGIVVEDVKGMETKEFKIKRKMFEYHYPSMELRIIK